MFKNLFYINHHDKTITYIYLIYTLCVYVCVCARTKCIDYERFLNDEMSSKILRSQEFMNSAKFRL